MTAQANTFRSGLVEVPPEMICPECRQRQFWTFRDGGGFEMVREVHVPGCSLDPGYIPPGLRRVWPEGVGDASAS